MSQILINPNAGGGGGGGTTSFNTDSGTAMPAAGVITIAGGSNINTSGAGSTVTINLDSSPSVSGSVTAGTGFTATTGDVTISSGNLALPNTSSSSVGNISIAGTAFFHVYPTITNNNIFIGNEAGNYTAGGANSVGIGTLALNAISGGFSVAIGTQSLESLGGGSQAVAVGYQSQQSTTGSSNTSLGYGTLTSLVGGTSNVAVGLSAGSAYTGSETNNLLLGASVTGVNAESNVIRVGNSSHAACYITGISGVTVTGTAVLCSATGQLGTVASSIRYKENIKDMGTASNAVFKLRPVTFNFKSDENKLNQYGLIAEEVQKILPDLVIVNDKGLPESVKYQDLPVLLLNEMQKLRLRIEQLENSNNCSCL